MGLGAKYPEISDGLPVTVRLLADALMQSYAARMQEPVGYQMFMS